MVKIEITPLEKASGQIIKSPEDIICGWRGTSLLLYCYKYEKNLIDWLNLLPDEFIEDCVDKNLDDFNDEMRQDFIQIALYLNCMDKNNWSEGLKTYQMNNLICEILNVPILFEISNRIIKKQGDLENLFLITLENPKKKWNLASYSFSTNQSHHTFS
jgi:hypothetical protein